MLELHPKRPLFKCLLETFKKLISVLTIFILITKASKKDKMILEKIQYIYYLLYFRKDKKNEEQALIDLDSKINAIILTYIAKLGLKIRRIDIKAQKINSSILKMFRIVLISF